MEKNGRDLIDFSDFGNFIDSNFGIVYAQGLENAGEIFGIVIKLVPFYIAYAGCTIIDSIFVGLGKTGYTAVNSLIINLGYYGIFYILYRAHAIPFTMNTIILMFGFGMVVHYGVSLLEEKVFFRRTFNAMKTK